MPLFDSIVLTEVSDIGDLELAGGMSSLLESVSELQRCGFGSPSREDIYSLDNYFDDDDDGGAGADEKTKKSSSDDGFELGLGFSFDFAATKTVSAKADKSCSTIDSDSGKFVVQWFSDLFMMSPWWLLSFMMSPVWLLSFMVFPGWLLSFMMFLWWLCYL